MGSVWVRQCAYSLPLVVFVFLPGVSDRLRAADRNEEPRGLRRPFSRRTPSSCEAVCCDWCT